MEATAIPDTIEIGVENSFDRASSQQKPGSRPERLKVDLCTVHRGSRRASGAAADYAKQRLCCCDCRHGSSSSWVIVVMGHRRRAAFSTEGPMERCTLTDFWPLGNDQLSGLDVGIEA